jgi:hypothetical protein
MFAIIPFKIDGMYRKSEAVKVYKHRGMAQNAADRLNEKDPTLDLVVREVRYLIGTHEELPGAEKLAGVYAGTRGPVTIEARRDPGQYRMLWTDENGMNRDTSLSAEEVKGFVLHRGKIS